MRHTVVDLDNDGVSDTGNGETGYFTDLIDPKGINESSEFSCTLEEQVRKNKRKYYATRIAGDGTVRC